MYTLIKNKILLKTIVKITLLSMVLAMSMFQFSLPANAGALTNMSDTMSQLRRSLQCQGGETDVCVYSNHTISLNLPAGTDFDAAGNEDMLTVDFPAEFIVKGNYAGQTSLFSLTDGTTNYVIEAVQQGTSPQIPNCTGVTGNNKVKVGVETDTRKVHFRACPGDSFTASETDLTAQILFDTGPFGGKFGNPDVADSYVIFLAVRDEGTDNAHSGSLAVSILSSDPQVQITATVDPYFTFQISSNTCALGTLTTSSVNTCQYTLAVGTNAENGAVITIQAISDGTNAYLNKDGAPGTYIDDITEDTTVTAGSEGYGIAVTAGSGWTEVAPFDDDDTPIPSSVTNILSTSGPISSSVTSTITHRAAISTTTEAGTYSQTVQYIATGTF